MSEKEFSFSGDQPGGRKGSSPPDPIIIIDFINMKSAEEKKELLAYLQRELKKDPNPGNVMGMTKLQLVEITRKKIRKTLEESLHG